MEGLQEDIDRRTYQIESLLHSAEAAGAETVDTLADQDDQLQKIKLSLVSVDTTLMDTKQNLSRLKGITRQVLNSVRTNLHRKIFSKILLHSTIKRNSSSPRIRGSSPNALRSSKSSHEISTDETSDHIGNALQRLKGIALDINDQLDGQAEAITDIHKHMLRATNSIEQQNRQMKKMFS